MPPVPAGGVGDSAGEKHQRLCKDTLLAPAPVIPTAPVSPP